MKIKDIIGDELEISLQTYSDGKRRLWICNTDIYNKVATVFNPSDIDTIIEALQEIKRSL